MGYRLREPRKGKAWIYWLMFILIAVPGTLWAAAGDTWIVFDCNRDNPNSTEYTYWDIWKLDPEGDGSQSYDSLFGFPLTTATSNEWDPTYSVHDGGGSVVFVSDKDGWPHLYKIRIDGTPTGSWKQLTFGECSTVDPCYNFAGNKIAYASNESGNWQIYTMNTDRSDVKQITQGPSDNKSPCFSRDGTKIYFISNRDVGATGDWEIYVVNSTGGTATKAIVDAQGQPLLLDYTEQDPCCSPTDPNIIVFASNVSTPTYGGHFQEVNRINYELFSYNLVSKDTNRLTDSWNEYSYVENGETKWEKQLWNSSMPCFSPNGQRIAWSASNWTNVGWQNKNPDGSYTTSYWKPNMGQGSSHQIWIRPLNQNNHHYWFPPSYWGWSGSGPGHGFWNGGHQHHMHYNPSWDDQP